MEQGKGAHRYAVSTQNPNDSIGGCGCFCGDRHVEDRAGPYVVSQVLTTDDDLSPYVVVCAPCVAGMATAIEGEALVLGQSTDSTAVEIIEPAAPPEREENPVSEDDWSEIPAI